MMTHRFLSILAVCLSGACLAQPYSITAFISPDVILPSDPSALESMTYNGQGLRVVFDRRVDDWVVINAHLFDVAWDDGLSTEMQVNPEFALNEAGLEAQKYAGMLGHLPACLRSGVHAVWIHDGVESFGGGFNAILIHTGQSPGYEAQGVLEEVLAHEAVHASLDPDHASAPGWIAAQAADGGSISAYGAASPAVEDLAESYLAWLMVRYRPDRIQPQDHDIITTAIPNRLAYLDTLGCGMHPMVDPLVVHGPVPGRMAVHPNPTSGLFTMGDGKLPLAFLEIWTCDGRKVHERSMKESGGEVDMAGFGSGVYLLKAGSADGVVYTSRVVVER